ncbi:MAG: hypothetical protein Q7S57_00765 [bacterium]|nr:hypothetical protein [bacterium]
MKILTSRTISILTIIVFGILAGAIFLRVGKVTVAKSILFVATKTENTLEIQLIDVITKRVTASKSVPVSDYLSSSQFSYPVQYNPETNEIFYLTKGQSEYDGAPMNKDGTSFSRFYKIGWNQTAPTLIFETSEHSNSWAVNKFDHSIMMSTINGQNQNIKKNDTNDGRIIFSKDIIKGSAMLNELLIPNDAEYIYQGFTEDSVNPNDPTKLVYNSLFLNKINNTNGEIERIFIHKNEAVEFNTNLSQNGRYLAFYAGKHKDWPANLTPFIFDLATKKVTPVQINDSISNLQLNWSGDNRLFLMLDHSLAYFDNHTNQVTKVFEAPALLISPTLPAVSENFFSYDVKGLQIFDIAGKAILDVKTDPGVLVVGMGWY